MTANQARQFPAIVLCGGKSSRMGSPKALVLLAGSRLIDVVFEKIRQGSSCVMINSNDPAIAVRDAITFADRIDGFKGPLAGIHAGLRQAAETTPLATHALFVPVDCPFLPADIAEQLAHGIASAESVVVASSRGTIHPVIGLWPLSLAGRIEEWLTSGKSLRMTDFLETCEVATIAFDDIATPFGPIDPFFNVNTPDDLDFARQAYEAMS